MNSIPLIKGNTPQEINTSIIALKKALSELEAQDRLLQGTDKDVQDKIKQINQLIEGINTHLGTVDTHLTTIDSQITALQPVDTVTSGNMHSVTSNAVAGALGGVKYLIPIRATFATTNSTDYVSYKQIGNNYSTYFNNLPEISGKTKKVRLLFNVYTQSSNAISIGLRRRNDEDYYVILEQSVWGGIGNEAFFSNLYWVEIDPSYLDSYTIIAFKTSDGNYQVGIGYCFAEVFYE